MRRAQLMRLFVLLASIAAVLIQAEARGALQSNILPVGGSDLEILGRLFADQSLPHLQYTFAEQGGQLSIIGFAWLFLLRRVNGIAEAHSQGMKFLR